MRVLNSFKNIYIGLLSQLILTLLSFFSRKVFLDSLGTEYLGINGLLTNILSMLSLVEGGIGASIIYDLYEPLAYNNKKKVISLYQLYKKIYFYIAILIGLLSLVLLPFLNIFVKEGINIPYFKTVYFIFIIKNIISYLNAHKWAIINADQKGYIITKYNLIFQVISIFLKILILKITENYILYLLIELLVFTFQNIWNGIIVDKNYSYLKTKEKYKVDAITKEKLIVNTKALLFHNIGYYCVFSTDNILISSFIGMSMVGLYSNYTLIINQVNALINPLLNGIGASVGNLVVTESKEKKYEIFNLIYFINFVIYSTCIICLYNLLELFIALWLGKSLLLDHSIFIIILVNLYLTGMRSSILTFKTKSGIFKEDKFNPVIEGIINLVVSIVLVQYIGLKGILLGTTISTICTQIWLPAKLVYNKIFEKSVIEYFKKYSLYMILTLMLAGITNYLCSFVIYNNVIISLILRSIISVTLPNIVYLFLFIESKEVKYILDLIKKNQYRLNRNISIFRTKKGKF